MSFTPTFKLLDINSIQKTNKWSLHPFLPPNPSDIFLASIRRTGILHPPIVHKLAGDRYELLCGYYRLQAAEVISPLESQIFCLILDSKIPREQLLNTVLEDQLTTGNLSSIEKAYFIKRCLSVMEPEEVSRHFLVLMGEKEQLHTINKLCRLLELEPELQRSSHKGSISDKTALELLRLNSGDRVMLHKIFLELELGGGKQNRLLTLSRDLAYRDNKTISELLTGSDYQTILTHSEMNQPQKIANLLTLLYKKLFPQSNSAKELFQKRVTQMNLPSVCSISHSQDFEKDEVTVALNFRNLREVEHRITEIKGIVE